MARVIELFQDTQNGLKLIGHEFQSGLTGMEASAAVDSGPSRAMHSPSYLALLQVQDTLTTLHRLAPSCRPLMPQRSLIVTWKRAVESRAHNETVATTVR
jgi:hypothetical protein